MKKLGKQKMKKIMEEKTGISIKDITTCGRYDFLGTIEKLTLGGYEVTHNLMSDSIEVKIPDYTDWD